MDNIGTWLAIAGFALTVGGVIWKLAISIDRVTQAVKTMTTAQGDLIKAKESQQSEIVDHAAQLRDHAAQLDRHEDELSKHGDKLELNAAQLAALSERTATPKLA